MVRSPMLDDPSGYYRALGVDPSATQEAITAAFRRKARLLHPDVPGTGDAAAFMRVKEAYDVVGDARRRAAYDHSAWAAFASSARTPAPRPRRKWRFAGVPSILWAGLGGALCVLLAMVGVQLADRGVPAPRQAARVIAPELVSAPLPRVRTPAGTTTYYVLPGSSSAVIWRRDAARVAYVPIGQLVAFTPVLAVRVVADSGLVEVRLAEGGRGYVDAARLAPGDRTAAHRAYCTYNAGAAPLNGEVLQRSGAGSGQLAISNRGEESAVVKLRDPSGRTAVVVFVAAGASTIVANLPDGRYRAEFAVGELWSRACQNFAAGMRAQRFADDMVLSGLLSLVIPPDSADATAAVDIPDAAFARD